MASCVPGPMGPGTTMVDSRPDYFVAMTDRPIEKSKGTFDCFKRARAAHISGEKIELL